MPSFDPNSAASPDSGIFGLPFSAEESALVLLPVPWEVTTSYGGGTSEGPRAVLEASRQVDLYDGDVDKPYEPGIAMLPEPEEMREWNRVAKAQAQKVIDAAGRIEGNPMLQAAAEAVNAYGERVNSWVHAHTAQWLDRGKIVGLVGGDHSVPFGAMLAMAERNPGFGILHFDAHSDTRDAYEGFRYSHASIMRNVLDAVPTMPRLVQVGIRDYCEEEVEYCRQQKDRVRIYFQRELAARKFEGTTWGALCREIVDGLPRDVWVSFDIDGLDPRFCPHTGTPVPGGLDFEEANYLLGEVVRSGRRIVGFDLNEVAPDPEGKDEWDANVGSRLLYKLCAWTLASQGKCRLR